jgi:molybdopterin-containing oxidoreductase family iron-sulfur binding subunit
MNPKPTRRDFLGKAAAAAAILTLAPGVTLVQAAPAASGKRWGLLIDSNKCTRDCKACVLACKSEMGLAGFNRPATDAQYIRKVELKDKTTGKERSLPVMCQHCANPPCVDVCPTGASMKRADGIVLVDRHICIGCRYCMMACPYKARSFAHEDIKDQKAHNPRGKGTVEACTLCVHRIDAGKLPACVEACASTGKGAMLFGDLNDKSSAIAKAVAGLGGTAIRADLGTEPGVRDLGL